MCICDRECQDKPHRRFRPIRTLFHLLVIYAVLVFGGGTLINTGNPVAVELGELIHTVTLIEPGIYWAHSSGHHSLAGGLQFLADGVNVGRLV